MQNKYVIAFLFTPFGRVWLIKKEKPEWQKNCLNGIGGKIEPGETPDQAIVRELKEEAGIDLTVGSDLFLAGRMEGVNDDKSSFEVHAYTGETNIQLSSMESEKISVHLIDEVKEMQRVANVLALIELCAYKLASGGGMSNFSHFLLSYNGN